ncbi:MAG: multidrug transporter [Gemmatimonadetes bacterium]|nr:MAG: multidrug transporter [Gemmatimonadota bacterium]
MRFVVAGGLLYAWMRARGAPRPDRAHWRATAVVGGLMLLVGNGAVVWAEQWVPSGLVALLIASVPLWMVLVEGVAEGTGPPGRGLVLGLVWGLAGVALLVSGRELGGGSAHDLAGALVVLAGSLAWAMGSIYSRRATLPASPRLATAMEMAAGGAMLLALGGLMGEWTRIDPDGVSVRSLLALAYLIVFGSLIAFTAYIWLLQVASAARVSTYAYVNPLVALLLGWALADEPLDGRTLVAAAVILSAVWQITRHGSRRGGVAVARAGAAAD